MLGAWLGLNCIRLGWAGFGASMCSAHGARLRARSVEPSPASGICVRQCWWPLGLQFRALSVAKVSAEALGLCLSRSRTGTTVLQPSVPSNPHLLYCPRRTDTENIHPLAVFLSSLPFSCVVPCLFSLLSCSMSPLFVSLRLRVSPSLPVSRNSGGRCLALVLSPLPLSARSSLAKPNTWEVRLPGSS